MATAAAVRGFHNRADRWHEQFWYSNRFAGQRIESRRHGTRLRLIGEAQKIARWFFPDFEDLRENVVRETQQPLPHDEEERKQAYLPTD